MPCQQLSSHGAREIIKVEDPDDAETPSEKESQCQLTNGDHDSPVRVGPARTKRRGTCLWAIRATQEAKEAL